MAKFFREAAALVLGVLVAAYFVEGIRYDNGEALAAAVVVLGVLNLLVRPILRSLLMFLALPLLMLTFGLAAFLVLWLTNALLFFATDKFLAGFHVATFGDAIWGALCVSVVWWLLNGIFEHSDERKRRLRRRQREESDVIDV
jgi:putative membrane protein